jgi:glycosyltransferase involved in cell wall biosynthesis
MAKLLEAYCPNTSNSIQLTGDIDNIGDYLSKSGLYLHLSRGEAWGISVTEAMLAGVIPIVSDCTGSMEVVRQVDARLITQLEIKEIVSRIKWFFSLDIVEKQHLSQKCRNIVMENYTEDKAIACFQKTFYDMYNEASTKLIRK